MTLLTLQERSAWDAALQNAGGGDVYHLASYHSMHEANGDGAARAYVYQDDGGTLFYPFMLRPIPNSDLYDIETVYGYSGPVTSNHDRTWLDRAWEGFSAWCRDHNVIAEFARFNPPLHNDDTAASDMTLMRDRDTVAIDLSAGPDALWSNYPSVQRNMVRKAESRGLTCREVALDEGLADFRRLYESSMQRLGAARQYFFSDAYYAAMQRELTDNVRLFAVFSGALVVAAALFFVYAGRLHYHLAGSDWEHRASAPNNLLLHTAANWGATNGLTLFHLGGGRTPAADDALLSFKASLSKLRLPFMLGKRVHLREQYDVLCIAWMQQHQPAARPAYFLLYRLS